MSWQLSTNQDKSGKTSHRRTPWDVSPQAEVEEEVRSQWEWRGIQVEKREARENQRRETHESGRERYLEGRKTAHKSEKKNERERERRKGRDGYTKQGLALESFQHFCH